jgi:hypothetical protein
MQSLVSTSRRESDAQFIRDARRFVPMLVGAIILTSWCVSQPNVQSVPGHGIGVGLAILLYFAVIGICLVTLVVRRPHVLTAVAQMLLCAYRLLRHATPWSTKRLPVGLRSWETGWQRLPEQTSLLIPLRTTLHTLIMCRVVAPNSPPRF